MAQIELSTVPLTTLDAVNVLLREVGIAEVTQLLNVNQDVQDAIDALNRSNVNIQGMGWHCNTEVMTLSPDTSGYISIPPNWVKLRAQRGTQTYALQNLTNRGGRLYSKNASTFLFTAPVQVEFVQVLDFEDLPAAIRWYITCDAGLSFGAGTYPSQGTFRFTQEMLTDAKAAALQDDDMERDTPLTGTSPHFRRMARGRPW